jgi:hypothetical protein
VFVPYRKFAATPDWLTAGPLVHRALDDESHDGLDPRIIDAERDVAPLVFGWLRYGDEGVGVVAEAARGTPSDFQEWLDPRIERWSDLEGVHLAESWRKPEEWIPGT